MVMSIHVALRHRTLYRYDRPIALGAQTVRLRPAPHARTPILSYALKVEPHGHFLNWQQDPQGNFVARLVVPEKTDHFEVTVDLVADMTVINPFDFFLEPDAEFVPFAYDPGLAEEIAPFLRTNQQGPLFAKFLASIDRGRSRSIDFLVGLNRRLAGDIRYVIRMEPGVQDPEQTLALGIGSCRDSAWLLVHVLRHLGIAARFVSGYLIQLAADQAPLDGPAGPSADFTDLHAWCEAYLPGAGWVGLDPTSGLVAGEGHIPLAATSEPKSAAPITGSLEQAETRFSVDMEVTRIREVPRVTKPYTEAQWMALRAAGDAVDERLRRGDVRLTMGGEPTFVSIDDPDGAEWNTAALGPTKRRRAGVLLRRLAGRFASGALFHYGQGKWYPGEQLPRWALSCHWRKDGAAIWRDPLLFATEGEGDGARADADDARVFAAALAERLGIDPDHAIPGYEDIWYYLWRERRLPTNVDPFDARLDDPAERARLARIFESGLDAISGYALPLRRDPGPGNGRWRSGPWFLRQERMFLLPGDSPIGLRLPLDSLPWAPPEERADDVPSDPFAPRAALPLRFQSTQPGRVSARPEKDRERLAIQRSEGKGTGRRGERASGVIRTALCVEPRDGRLHVFMPPIEAAEDYLDLIAAVEDTAARIGRAVTIEGYPPPRDPRLAQFSVTPDPGVIEVNIHPSSTWNELVERTTVLYDEARATRLGAEKFMLDGRHVGTGGGNHVVLGAAQPADSPFLRRPDLLRSLVAYWQHHPSLSYLFSGLFIGPTSQHPRIDEARGDTLHEFDIAAAQVDRGGTEVSPWLVDRIFRNILVDVTGNTHRAEFCIDKLYSPDGPAGRLGLLELRAFEMPPHARMSLAQQLLLRALVARFWEEPYRRSAIRWGTRLHDDFMLPHFCMLDFGDVLAELRETGLAIDPSWFEPHREFRFPVIGEVACRGMELELRHALEPWHVLGEEGGGGGTVRYVDSSVERIQARMTGFVPERFMLACNGRAVPLRATGRAGEYVAGIRFKAWAPTSALHPTIGVHAPLVLDVFDRWNGRSLGGCTYHVAHPGGRNYDRFPVNANEAAARRRARFFAIGHTPGAMPEPAVATLAEMPLTLDLRAG
jgi:uncharacterized protein (DUF2126 family)/transglutaminase-like putative cysteine protease